MPRNIEIKARIVNTVNGKVTVRDTPFNTRIQTVEGSVTVDLPLTTDVTFTANTISGTIDSAVPVGSNRRSRRGVVADVNDAAVPTLFVMTIGGDITVRRR